MTEDNRMPNFWWCPTHHLYRGGEERPCADAVRLVPAPPAPRVFFPGDTVPANVWTVDRFHDVVEPSDDPWTWHGSNPLVELAVPSPEEWQAAVDRARDERADAEWQHTEGTNP